MDDFLNKREIGHKAPSEYMRLFSKKNDKLEATMKTHLIGLNTFGVWEDDYEKFFKKRCEAIAKELQKRVIRQAIDELEQEINLDDLEESELET